MLHCCNRLIIVLLSLVSIFAHAQLNTRENKKLFFKANNDFDYGNYPHAMVYYQTLYKVDSTSDELNFKLGVCIFENKGLRPESKKYFEKVSKDAYPETYYYLGQLYHLEGNFDKAIDIYHDYVKLKTEKEHTVKEVEDLIDKSYYAKSVLQNKSTDITIENMGPVVNSEYSEYAPLLPTQEDKLFFTSRRKNDVWTKKDALGNYYEDIYVSENKDGVWTRPHLLDSTVNSPYHDAGCGISADGEKLLIYHTSDDHLHGHIYISEYKNGKWTKPASLHAHVNSPHNNETSACFSPDGEMIFFSSDRPGGYGGKDIYSVKKAPNGQWAMPKNLGPAINTEYNEDAPFVHPFDSVLYFSSEGHQNMGGYDVFSSRFDEVENFTVPVNIGIPINTVDDDIFFVMNASGSKGYISSKRPGGYGLYDLYVANFAINNLPLNVYDVKIFDADSNRIKKVEITLSEMEKHEVYGQFKSNATTGKCIIISKPYRAYRVVVQADGYDPVIIDNYVLGDDLALNFTLNKK